MRVNREDLGLGVKMVNGGLLHIPKRYAEGSILNHLEMAYGGRGCVRVPNGSSVCE